MCTKVYASQKRALYCRPKFPITQVVTANNFLVVALSNNILKRIYVEESEKNDGKVHKIQTLCLGILRNTFFKSSNRSGSRQTVGRSHQQDISRSDWISSHYQHAFWRQLLPLEIRKKMSPSNKTKSTTYNKFL